MRTLLLAGTAAMTSLALIVLTVLRDMLSQEVRVRIERLPFAVLRLAARQIPADLRDTICRDWEAELAYVLSNEAGAGPITRLIVANKWALSMLLLQGGRQTAKELHAYEPPELKGFEDIRQLPRSERRRFVTLTARLKDLCSGPVDIFTENALVRLVNAVSVACEAFIGDRSERLALGLAAPLVEGAHPMASRLGRNVPAMLDVRRSYAHARLQLDEALAERLLRNLHLDEISVFGHGDPRTFPTLALYWWAVGRAGRFEEAEAGLHTLESNMVRLSNPDPALLRHVQCKRSWNLGQLGRKNEMLRGYEAVTSGRSRELGVSHGDTLDARHSVGKMLVWCGDQAQAVEILRSVLAERRRLQGRHHPDTLETKKYFFLARAVAHPTSIAITRWRLRRALHRILNEQIHVRGSDHPDTLDTRRCLAAIADPTERS